MSVEPWRFEAVEFCIRESGIGAEPCGQHSRGLISALSEVEAIRVAPIPKGQARRMLLHQWANISPKNPSQARLGHSRMPLD